MTYRSNRNFLIGETPPSELPPQLQSALTEVYVGMQQVIKTFMEDCGIDPRPVEQWSTIAGNGGTIKAQNLNRIYVHFSDAMTQSQMVNLYDNAGVLNARKANATDNTKVCHGYCNVASVGIGEIGEVIVGHGIAPAGGLVMGTNYFLATADGLVTAIAPVAAGNIEQFVGVAVATDQIFFNCNNWVQH